MIAAHERVTGLCFDLIAKQRFDHELLVHANNIRLFFGRALSELDSLWHATSDYFLLGSRTTMGKALSALFTGGCSVHPLGLQINTTVLGRRGVDLKYIQGHGVFPQAIRQYDDLSHFISSHKDASWHLQPNSVGVYCDRHGYYSRGKRTSAGPGRAGRRGCWIDRKPAEHLCYAEAELVGTVLTHQLAFYDAAAAPHAFVAGAQANDWKLTHEFL